MALGTRLCKVNGALCGACLVSLPNTASGQGFGPAYSGFGV